MQKILDKFWEEWYREVPLHKKICQLFEVNDGSTFEIKGLYIMALILGAIFFMLAIPWVIWSYIGYIIGSILFIISGLMFIRTFIKKASWAVEKDSKDGQD